MFVIGGYRDGLAISTILLDPPCDLELLGRVDRFFRQRLGIDNLARLIEENEIIGNERLDYLPSGRVNMIVDLRRRRLRVFAPRGPRKRPMQVTSKSTFFSELGDLEA